MTNAIVKKKKVCYNNTGGNLKNKTKFILRKIQKKGRLPLTPS